MYKNGLFQETKKERPTVEQIGEVYINAYIEGENTPMTERREAGKEAAYTKWPWLRPMIAASGPMSKSRGGIRLKKSPTHRMLYANGES